MRSSKVKYHWPGLTLQGVFHLEAKKVAGNSSTLSSFTGLLGLLEETTDPKTRLRSLIAPVRHCIMEH